MHNAPQGEVLITYILSDAEGDDAEVWLKASSDSGTTYLANTDSVTGDVGYPVSPGNNLQITWNYNDTISNIEEYRVKVVADDQQSVGIQSIVNQVDSNRLKSTLQFVTGIRHRNTGLSHLNDVKDTIEQRFRNYGLQTSTQSFNFQGYTAQNINGRIQGHQNEKVTYIIDAHFDAVADAPGADDNGSGVAGFLEAARILSQYNFDHSIRVIGFDLEESGLVGSNQYVNNGLKTYDSIAGVYNYEMIGYYTEEHNSQSLPTGFQTFFPNAYAQVEADTFQGDFITNVANGSADSLWMSFDSAAAWYVPGLEVVTVSGNQVSSVPDLRRSDHASFWDAGYDALLLTDGADFRNPNYHEPSDTFETVNIEFMSNVVKATIGAICHRAGIQHSTTASMYVRGLLGVDEVSKTTDFNLYPNPAQSIIRLETRGYAGDISVKIYDNTGRLVMQKEKQLPGNGALEMDINQLSQGIYHVELQDDEFTSRKKLVVQ